MVMEKGGFGVDWWVNKIGWGLFCCSVVFSVMLMIQWGYDGKTKFVWGCLGALFMAAMFTMFNSSSHGLSPAYLQSMQRAQMMTGKWVLPV